MKDIELLPCPFCGAACHFEKDEGAWEWVECESCGMQGNRSASLMDDCKPILAAAWNRRAAIEADRAQRVPDGWKLVPVDPVRSMVDAAERVDWADSDVRGNIYNMWNVMLASTPAPAQQEPAEPMDAHRAAYFMRRFLHEEKMLGPNEQAALHFTIAALEAMESAAQHQEPPQQERKPMTDEVVREGFAACGVGGINARLGFVEGVKFAERHHGIKE